MKSKWGILLGALAVSLGGCVTTSMQGYADRELPPKPLSHIAALVAAPQPMASSIQSNLISEGAKASVAVQDVQEIFPPTRQYSDDEIKHELSSRGFDGVLIVSVGDSGIQQQYAGTVFSSSFDATAYGGGVSGYSYGTAEPIYHYQRKTDFTAKLIDPLTGRTLWVGNGQVNAGGALFVGDNVGASNTAAAIFNDLRAKNIIATAQ